MAVELLDFNRLASLERDKDAQEAAYAGLESMERLIQLLSHQHSHPKAQRILQKDCSAVVDATICKFKKVVSLLGRSGHARFRRAPGGRAAALAHLSDSALMEAKTNCSSLEGTNLDSQCLEVSPKSSIRYAHANLPDAVQGIVSTAVQENSVPNAIFSKNEQAKNAHWLTSSCERQSITYTNSHPTGTQAVFMLTDPCVSISQPTQTNIATRLKGCEPAPLSSYPPQDFLVQRSITKAGECTPHTEVSYGKSRIYAHCEHSLSCTPPPSTTNSSFLSSLSIDGSVTNRKSTMLQQAFGGVRPQFCPAKKKCLGSKSEDMGTKCHSLGNCHCAKRRKSRSKRVVMVPFISSKMADIPTDEFSWRKYGQKPIKGSPHPRGYYRCSTVRGCPAKKHVERALDDANMLVVTYEGEHSHSQGPREDAKLM
eukprot:c1497_g1_i1 orf=528-1805(-)